MLFVDFTEEIDNVVVTPTSVAGAAGDHWDTSLPLPAPGALGSWVTTNPEAALEQTISRTDQSESNRPSDVMLQHGNWIAPVMQPTSEMPSFHALRSIPHDRDVVSWREALPPGSPEASVLSDDDLVVEDIEGFNERTFQANRTSLQVLRRNKAQGDRIEYLEERVEYLEKKVERLEETGIRVTTDLYEQIAELRAAAARNS